MSQFSNAAAVLERAGYTIAISQEQKRPTFAFEDDQVIGFAVEFKSQSDMLANWLAEQDEFLRKNTFALRKAGHKSWNIYFLILCNEGQEGNISLTQEIEEDFRGTRKIVSVNPETEQDLVRSLLPLLPIQNNVQTRDDQSRRLLFDRLDLPDVAKEAVEIKKSVDEFLKSLIEAS